MQTPWTEERCLLLDQLWVAGQPASKIADQLGGGITRNAVIGKAQRRCLPKHVGAGEGRPRLTKSSTPRIKKARTQRLVVHGKHRHMADVVEKEPVTQIVDREIPVEQQRTFLELTAGQCRYPVGEPTLFFCGAPTRKDSFYCPGHHQRCHSRERVRQYVSYEINNFTKHY